MEEAIRKMSSDEKAHVWIFPGKWGFCKGEKPEIGVPENTTIEYIIHLKKFQNVSVHFGSMCCLILAVSSAHVQTKTAKSSIYIPAALDFQIWPSVPSCNFTTTRGKKCRQYCRYLYIPEGVTSIDLRNEFNTNSVLKNTNRSLTLRLVSLIKIECVFN